MQPNPILLSSTLSVCLCLSLVPNKTHLSSSFPSWSPSNQTYFFNIICLNNPSDLMQHSCINWCLSLPGVHWSSLLPKWSSLPLPFEWRPHLRIETLEKELLENLKEHDHVRVQWASATSIVGFQVSFYCIGHCVEPQLFDPDFLCMYASSCSNCRSFTLLIFKQTFRVRSSTTARYWLSMLPRIESVLVSYPSLLFFRMWYVK